MKKRKVNKNSLAYRIGYRVGNLIVIFLSGAIVFFVVKGFVWLFKYIAHFWG